MNAVNVSFGASSKQILDWGQNNAASFGLSQRAFNQAVVPMGSILKNTGLDMGTVSDSTITLTERAADMASVFNVDVSEALEAIQAGLRGEADPLERFGVGLNAAAVEAKALADTGKDSAEALTDQEKMLARVALIMEQTSQVQGDFANTSGEAANAQRIATAEMENAQAVIGQAFLPVMAALAGAVADVARWFQDLPGPVQTVAAVILAVAAAALIVIPRLVAVSAAIKGVGISAATTGKLMLGVLGPIGLLIAAGQALGDVFNDNDEQFAKLDKSLTALVEDGKADEAKKQLERYAGALDMLGVTADEVLPGYTAALAANEAEAKAGAKAQKEFAKQTGGAKQQLEDAKNALDEYVAAQRAAVDPVLGLMDALQQQKEAQDAVDKAVRDHGKSSAEARQAARELASATLGAEEAASDADLSFDAFDKKLREWVKQSKMSEQEADILRDSIKGARQQADLFRGKRVADLIAEVDQKGLNAAEATLDWVARTRKAIVAITTVGDTIGGWFSGMEHGGITPASHAAEGGPRGNSVLVGEQGPELVDLAPGSMVHPAGATRNMLANAAGGEQRIVLELRAGSSRVDELLLEILRNSIRVRGGDVQVVLGR